MGEVGFPAPNAMDNAKERPSPDPSHPMARGCGRGRPATRRRGRLRYCCSRCSRSGFSRAATANIDATAKPPVATEMDHITLFGKAFWGSYTELASGLIIGRNAWARSQETISIVNGYGVATQALHSVVFSPSITDVPESITSTRWEPAATVVRGLAYYDYASGKSTMICECRSSTGIVDSNTVVYPDCSPTESEAT